MVHLDNRELKVYEVNYIKLYFIQNIHRQYSSCLIVMNVRSNHQLNNQLNYYSRSSPRHRKKQPSHPLFTYKSNSVQQTPPSINKTMNNMHSNTQSRQIRPKRNRNEIQILIEDEVDEFVLDNYIRNDQQISQKQSSPMSEMKMSFQPQEKRQKIPSTTLSVQSNKDQEEYEEIMKQSFHHIYKNQNCEIRIQDDEQSDQSDSQQLMQVNPQPITNISLHSHNYSMHRHFSFGHGLPQPQNQVNPTMPESDMNFQQPATPELQLTQKITPISSLLYPMQEPPQKLKKDNTLDKSKKKRLQIDLMLIQDSEQEISQNIQQYVSPKFNEIELDKKLEDHWITKDNYQDKNNNNFFYESPSNQTSAKLYSPPKSNYLHPQTFLIQKDQIAQRQLNDKKHKISQRPYGSAILSINKIMEQIPQKFIPYYEQMHKKLVIDQIQIQQELNDQEHKIRILKMLIWFKKQGINGQKYLLSSCNTKTVQFQEDMKIIKNDKELDKQLIILLNQLMIQCLIKKIISKRR